VLLLLSFSAGRGGGGKVRAAAPSSGLLLVGTVDGSFDSSSLS
jgi:hypothetical protein